MREELIAEIDAFLARPEVAMTETTFGRLAVNDGKFVGRIRSGGRIWPETEQKVQQFIRSYQPKSGAEHGAAA